MKRNIKIENKKEFKKLKIWESIKLKDEPIGLNGLRSLANEIYGENVHADDILNPNIQKNLKKKINSS